MLHLSQSEYLEMVKQLEESKNMEAEERARLEAEINAKREEVSESKQDFISTDVARKKDFKVSADFCWVCFGGQN